MEGQENSKFTARLRSLVRVRGVEARVRVLQLGLGVGLGRLSMPFPLIYKDKMGVFLLVQVQPWRDVWFSPNSVLEQVDNLHSCYYICPELSPRGSRSERIPSPTSFFSFNWTLPQVIKITTTDILS